MTGRNNYNKIIKISNNNNMFLIKKLDIKN